MENAGDHRLDNSNYDELLNGFNSMSLYDQGTTPFNPDPFPLNGITELDRFCTVCLILKPHLLYRFACNEEGIERFINTIANCPFLLGMLLDSLSEILVEVASNAKGRRVIMYCFTNVEPSCRVGLTDKMIQNYLQLATDKSGCILLNDCIPLMEEAYQEVMLSIICNNAHFLAQHSYGTYVVQNVVSSEHAHFTPRIVMEITPLFLVLSMQKEGSHLVEKCIQSCLTREIAVEALVKLNSAEIQQIACNEFGNFVIQKALISTKDSLLGLMLRSTLLPLVKDLKRNKFGRNVVSKLQDRSNSY